MKAIVKKARNQGINNQLGYVDPILLYSEEYQKYVPVKEGMFPNSNEIFIFGAYNSIDNSFNTDALFELYDITHNEDKYDKINPRSCFYSASGYSINELSNTQILEIIEGKFDVHRKKLINFSTQEAPFFLKDGMYLYGPLLFDANNLEWKCLENEYFNNDELENSSYEMLSDYEDCVFKFEFSKITDCLAGDYVLNINELLNKSSHETIYVLDKEKIISWGKNHLLKSELFSKNETEILTKLSNLKIPNVNSKLDKIRLEKFMDYFSEVNEWVNVLLPNYLESFLNSDKGRDFRESYLDDNANTYFEQYRREEIQNVNDLLEQKKQDLKKFENEIELKRDNIVEDKIFDGVSEDEKSILRNLISNQETRNQIINLKTLQDAQNDLANIQNQKKEQEVIIDYLRTESEKLNSQKNSITEAIRKVKNEFYNDSQFTQKLVEARLFTDILNNIDPSDYKQETDNHITKKIPPKLSLDVIDGKNFINVITERLSQLNRNIEYNDVANYIVSIHQNFLTIFAGYPGIGKTSLVEKIANALGSYKNGRYLSIPVQKGWTSSKDFIGFYNPLNQKYQPSKTNLYKHLTLLQEDYLSNQEFPSIVLLDEANLSPIEHYWSDFSSVYDDDYKKEIKIANEQIIKIGSGLRFVATINYDHTTEILSDRLISRAPIIKLLKSEYTSEINDNHLDFLETFVITDIDNWLAPKDDIFKGDVKSRFEAIVKILEDDETSDYGQPIIVSPRKLKSVERYCSVAGSLMSGNSKFIALDYAINQNILPLINGRGDKYKRRLINLQEKLQNLPLSNKHLTKMIQAGDNNFNHYKFFY